MTRTKTAGTSMGNVARARIANRADAALFLRIHADGSRDFGAAARTRSTPSLRAGWTDDVYADSKRAARIVQGHLRAALGFPDRGLQERADFTGFNWSDVPVILVEMGFMTNPTEDRLLARVSYQRRGARPVPRHAPLPRSLADQLSLDLGLVLLVESDCSITDEASPESERRAIELALPRIPPRFHDRGQLGDGDPVERGPLPGIVRTVTRAFRGTTYVSCFLLALRM